MIIPALEEAALRGELILVQDGFCRWHRRRDGVVTIRELFVLPCRRRTGLGKSLVAEVIIRCHRLVIRARCPVAYEANGFWRHLGFTLVSTKDGINTWQRPAHG